MPQQFQNKKQIALATLILFTAVSGCAKKASDDPVEYSFVVVGCNRMDKGDVDVATNPSTANLPQLDRTYDDISKLTPKPDYLFFAGDMVYGYEMDSNKLAAEFMAWRKHYEESPAAKAGIKLVAIPGNHETEDTAKLAFPLAEEVWMKVMSPYIDGSNGPHAGGPDSLATDQSRLTYSFDFHDTHFVVMNTDPVGQDAHVPAHWIASDLVAARKAGAKHIFAIGHKPAFSFDGAPSGLVAGNRGDFWGAMEANHAEAMLSAHNHVYYRFQPHASLPGNGHTWMVIAGNGGSPLEKDVTQKEHFYGFTLVSVLKSGKVIVKSYGRDLPAEGYAAACPADKYPTTLRDSLDITWKN